MKLINSQSFIIYDGKEISCSDIIQCINKVYQTLLAYKLTDDKKIALYLDRDVSILYAIIAILSTNSLYIPIDTAMPINRAWNIIENSKADVIITNEKYKDRFNRNRILCIENILNVWEVNDIVNFTNELGNGGAYILYTSGTTGFPKGVLISKNALENFVEGTKSEINFNNCSTILCLTSISFDIFFVESIFALHIGLKVIMANMYEQQNPRKLLRLLLRNNVDTLQLTPSRLKQLYALDKNLQWTTNIKLIIIGGEAFPENMLKPLQAKLNGNGCIYNAYGPTETTIWVSYSLLNYKMDIDIGHPINHNDFYIVNTEGDLITSGETGELWISGHNLADCYYNDPDLTHEKFVYLQKSSNKVRVYKSGDLCTIQNGNIKFVGRKDNQVKLNGFRVELEEIEACIAKCDGVINCIVYCEKSADCESIILTCIYCGDAKTEDELKSWISDYLPSYMIPHKYIWVSRFDYSISGKVDRNLTIKHASLKS